MSATQRPDCDRYCMAPTGSHHERCAASRAGQDTTLREEIAGRRLIAEERSRQIEAEGWSQEHDREPGHAFALMKAGQAYLRDDPSLWPWPDGWKPKSKLRNLARAGALFQAALDTGHVVAQSGNAEGFRNVCARLIDDLCDDFLALPSVRRLLDAEARAHAAEAKVAVVQALARDGERFPSYDPRHRITPDLLRRALDGDA